FPRGPGPLGLQWCQLAKAGDRLERQGFNLAVIDLPLHRSRQGRRAGRQPRGGSGQPRLTELFALEEEPFDLDLLSDNLAPLLGGYGPHGPAKMELDLG